jgi:hypothetical protein
MILRRPLTSSDPTGDPARLSYGGGRRRWPRDCLFIAECFGDEHAVLLARALFESTFVRMKSIRVWREDVLVHEAEKPKVARSRQIN